MYDSRPQGWVFPLHSGNTGNRFNRDLRPEVNPTLSANYWYKIFNSRG